MAEKLIIDCTTGETSTEPLTDDEAAEREAAGLAAAEREAAQETAEQEWRDAIRNASSLGALKAVLAGDSGAGRAERRPT